MIDMKQMPADSRRLFIRATLDEIRRIQREQPALWDAIKARAEENERSKQDEFVRDRG